MEKSNANLLQKIQKRLFADPLFLVGARLEIAKIIFIAVASVYFLAFLFSARAFDIDGIGTLLYVTYPVFVFAVFHLLYQLASYIIYIHAPEKSWMLKIIFGALAVLFCFILGVHLRFIAL